MLKPTWTQQLQTGPVGGGGSWTQSHPTSLQTGVHSCGPRRPNPCPKRGALQAQAGGLGKGSLLRGRRRMLSPFPAPEQALPAARSSLSSSFLTASDLRGDGFVVPISALSTCLMNERNNVIKNLKVGWGESFPSLGLIPKHPEGHICIQIIDILITNHWY